MSEGREPAMRACAVCGRVLDHYEETHGSPASETGGWIHSVQDREHGEDHPAVPVTLQEIEMIGRCDFCNVDFPRWVIPVRSFQLVPGSMSQGDWAACNTCCELIANRKWYALTKRAVEHSAHRGLMPDEQLRASLAILYSRVRKNITGEPHPITQR